MTDASFFFFLLYNSKSREKESREACFDAIQQGHCAVLVFFFSLFDWRCSSTKSCGIHQVYSMLFAPSPRPEHFLFVCLFVVSFRVHRRVLKRLFFFFCVCVETRRNE